MTVIAAAISATVSAATEPRSGRAAALVAANGTTAAEAAANRTAANGSTTAAEAATADCNATARGNAAATEATTAADRCTAAAETTATAAADGSAATTTTETTTGQSATAAAEATPTAAAADRSAASATTAETTTTADSAAAGPRADLCNAVSRGCHCKNKRRNRGTAQHLQTDHRKLHFWEFSPNLFKSWGFRELVAVYWRGSEFGPTSAGDGAPSQNRCPHLVYGDELNGGQPIHLKDLRRLCSGTPTPTLG
jgi:hypothetical protein